MNDLNTVTLSGRITKEVQVKEVSNGWCIYNFDIANGYSEKDKSGQWGNKTNFIRCKMFRKGSEFLKYLSKGQMIAISGTLRQENWEKEGQKRSAIVVMVDSLVLCGGKTDNKSRTDESKPTQNDEPMQNTPDQEIPF